MGPRPFTRRQALENRAFLAALRRTGNARLAARALGVHRATYLKRRARSAAFAADWEAALAFAQAALRTGGPPPPALSLRAERDLKRTLGGEPALVRLKSGRMQLRRAPAGRITKAAEQAFLRALSACANVRLAAAAAGFSHSAFYQRAKKSRAFAREMRLALATGYRNVECAALEAALPESYADDAWRHNDPPPMPPLTASQAFQLLVLHQKSVCQSWDEPHRRKRRGEPWDTYTERLRAMWLAEKARAAEDDALREAARTERRRGEPYCEYDEMAPPPLPDLAQVTGWSKADPEKAPHDPDKALFGGWRLKDWKRSRK